MINISKEVSKHLFLKNLSSDNDNSLYSIINYIRNRKIAKECEENKNEQINRLEKIFKR